MERKKFHVGEYVQVGPCGERGCIKDIFKPLGTYDMFIVKLERGPEVTAALHELVKGLPLDEILPIETRALLKKRFDEVQYGKMYSYYKNS